MSEPLFFSRARLSREASVSALAPLLIPSAQGDRLGAAHRLVWSLFAGDPDAKRDFLYREIEAGSGGGPGRSAFLILSRREPVDAHDLFRLETKLFEPALAAGDRLAFSLRANPTVARGAPGSGRGKPHDAIAIALRAVSGEERSCKRQEIVVEAARRWLDRKSRDAGFSLLDPQRTLRADRDDWVRIRRRGRDVTFGTIDLEGMLTVTDPKTFLAAVARGFGRAKAFGCGLMLIKRA